MASEKESKWIAFMTLSLCIGASIYLLTGEGDKAFAMVLILAVVLTLIVVLSPGGGRKSTKEIYGYAIAMLILPLLLVKLGYYGRRGQPPPWEDLQARYAARRPAPSGLQIAGPVVVNRKVGQFMVQPQDLRRVSTTLAENGVHLEPGFPSSLLFDAVFVPINSIRQCRREPLKSEYATLRLQDLTLEIEVSDDDGRVRAWCALHEISDGSEERGS